MNNRAIVLTIGIIIFLVGVLGIFNAFNYDRIYDVFWFCYLGSILLGAGIITSNVSLIKSQLYILVIPDIIWAVDFFTRLSTGKSAVGIVDYFFIETNILVKIVSLQHLFILPLALLAIWFIGKPIRTNNKGMLISVIQVTFIYLATLIFTPVESNVNCAYRLCSQFAWTTNLYPLIWFAGVLVMLFATRYLLNLLLKKFIKE
jgi:hypothetical protein